MSDERRRILTKLSEGKMSVEEAEALLGALDAGPEGSASGQRRSGSKPKYIRVLVNDGDRRVNVRAPIGLIRAAAKFGALIPDRVRADIERQFSDHGMELDLKGASPEDIDAFVEHLSELIVEIDQDDRQKVRIFCE